MVHRAAQPGDGGASFTAHGPGILAHCSKCRGGVEQYETYLIQISGLTGDARGCSFAEYWTGTYGEAPLRAARRVLERGGWLTLIGPYGRGKTYLLSAIVNEAVRLGKRACYVKMEALLEFLRWAYKPGAEVDSDARWRLIVDCDVLCIDEVEKYNPTSWAESKLHELIDERYRHHAQRATCFATNDIADCPGALKSRMMDGRFSQITLSGGDVRLGLRRRDENSGENLSSVYE